MNKKFPTGLVGYRTPTEPPTGNVTRLLRPEPGTVPAMNKAQAIVARAQLAIGVDAQFEDVWESLNRAERRCVAQDARMKKRELARRDARRKQRADKKAKKFAKSLVEV